MAVKIVMAGACGRMGRRILELTATTHGVDVGGAFDLPDNVGRELHLGGESGHPRTVVVGEAASEIAHGDVLIDFTAPGACIANVRTAVLAGKPAVVGTTGLTEAQVAELNTFAESTAIVYAPNMSVGVNLLFKLVREVAGILGLDYNVEIVEAHHNLKKDSPSGTAVRLAERVAEGLGLDYATQTAHGREGLVGERPRAEIGMHAIRGGATSWASTRSASSGRESGLNSPTRRTTATTLREARWWPPSSRPLPRRDSTTCRMCWG